MKEYNQLCTKLQASRAHRDVHEQAVRKAEIALQAAKANLNMVDAKDCNWVEALGKPFAFALGAALGCEVAWFGPAGLGSHLMIDLTLPDGLRTLTVSPGEGCSSLVVVGDKQDKHTTPYAKGTIGALNSLGLERIDIPDDATPEWFLSHAVKEEA